MTENEKRALYAMARVLRRNRVEPPYWLNPGTPGEYQVTDERGELLPEYAPVEPPC